MTGFPVVILNKLKKILGSSRVSERKVRERRSGQFFTGGVFFISKRAGGQGVFHNVSFTACLPSYFVL